MKILIELVFDDKGGPVSSTVTTNGYETSGNEKQDIDFVAEKLIKGLSPILEPFLDRQKMKKIPTES